MKIPALRKVLCILSASFAMTATSAAQGINPYPNAVTDRAIHLESPMSVPPTNVVVTDPDFGSSIVRATDEMTNFKLPGTALVNEASGEANEWSADGRKFYVMGHGGQVLAFAFDPSAMAVSSLPGADSGQAFLVPLRPGPTFSFVDPDLIYGTGLDDLTIMSYRFSTGALVPVLDTRTCGVQPPLGSGPSVKTDYDVSLSLDDSRVSISEGPVPGKDMFVVVNDKKLGCRWYNTQTGQIGGQWGPSGNATASASYLIRHAYLARSGKYIHILSKGVAYFWDVATLNVTSCVIGSDEECGGYGVMGYNSYVNGPGMAGDMVIVKRPLSDLSAITPLVYPPLSPEAWGQPEHFTWSNVDSKDSMPVCGSTYSYDGDTKIDQPFAGEIWCVETDGLASTVWRFAHNRAIWIKPYFNTQPLGNVSRDGRFFLFSSDWDAQLGIGTDGRPRSDVFILKLN